MAVETRKKRLRGVDYSRNSSAKSMRDQASDHKAAADELYVGLVQSLSDSTSVSRYATKARANWKTIVDMLPDIDIVLMWEASRGDRTLATWIGFLDGCREHGA